MRYLNPDNPHSATVLLAEDDDELRDLLAFCFYQQGYSVTSCADGQSLLEKVEAGLSGGGEPIDLVITDIRMPGLTGLEVLGALEKHAELPPVICMTAFGDHQTHQLAEKLRARAILDKPFDIGKLIATARALCPPQKSPSERLPV